MRERKKTGAINNKRKKNKIKTPEQIKLDIDNALKSVSGTVLACLSKTEYITRQEEVILKQMLELADEIMIERGY